MENKTNIRFAALDPYEERNIISPCEKSRSGVGFVEWGDGNKYPEFLNELYTSVPTLRSIINGNVDFICGDGATLTTTTALNRTGETIEEQLRAVALDYEIFGGFALQIIRDKAGRVAEVYHIDMRFLRANKECDVFFYCEDWKKGGRKDAIVYPAYMPNLEWNSIGEEGRKTHAASILYIKNVRSQTYPAPVYAASVKACEIERNIDDYHLNSINNGFAGSAIVNFCNGVPEDSIKEEIERNFTEKFSGGQNAGRVMFSWNDGPDSRTTIDTPEVTDFGEKYEALSEHSRQQIFTAFRAAPALFGIIDKTGFNEVEYESAFRLYNRTQIRPVQRLICDAYDKIYGVKNCLTIAPFSLEGGAGNVN